MKHVDQYHKWVEWSEEDQIYIRKCPDLITGIHGEDPVSLYRELCQVVAEVIDHFMSQGRSLPYPRVPSDAGSCLAHLPASSRLLSYFTQFTDNLPLDYSYRKLSTGFSRAVFRE